MGLVVQVPKANTAPPTQPAWLPWKRASDTVSVPSIRLIAPPCEDGSLPGRFTRLSTKLPPSTSTVESPIIMAPPARGELLPVKLLSMKLAAEPLRTLTPPPSAPAAPTLFAKRQPTKWASPESTVTPGERVEEPPPPFWKIRFSKTINPPRERAVLRSTNTGWLPPPSRAAVAPVAARIEKPLPGFVILKPPAGAA